MRRLAGTLVAGLVACDTPGAVCGDGVHAIGALCYPDEAVVRVGYGFAPTAMAAADLDADGVLDVAAVSPSRQTLTVAWGPDRRVATSWAIGEEIAGLAVADLDGDGALDLATALPGSDAVAVLHGRGGRRFDGISRVAAGDSPRAVIAVAGGALVTGNIGDGSVSVLRGGARRDVIVGPGPHALAGGDVDGDGVEDVVVALAEEGAVQVLLGDGAGLRVGERFAVGAAPLAIVAADLDGDAAIDVATADALDDTVTVRFGDGAGGARETTVWVVPGQPRQLVAMRDEMLGVLTGQASVVGRLDPRTGALATAASEGAVTGLLAGDLDGDGTEELVHAGAGTLQGLRPAGGVGVRFEPAWARATDAAVAAVLDVGGDGTDDLIVAGFESDVLRLIRGVDGQLLTTEIPGGDRAVNSRVVAGDVNGDGLVDLVVVAPQDGTTVVSTYLQSGVGFAASGAPIGIVNSPHAAVLGDADADGGADLVISTSSPFRTWLLRGDGVGGWAEPRDLGISDPYEKLVAADVDGDERMDLVGLSAIGPMVLVRDVGGVVLREELAIPEGWHDISVAELDGDSEADAVVCSWDGLWFVRRLVSYGLHGEAMPITTAPCASTAVRDADGDGDLDVLSWWPRAEGDAITLAVNDGAGAFTVLAQQAVPSGWGARQPADLDGDGVLDVVAADGEFLHGLRGVLSPALVESVGVELGGELLGGFADLDGDGLRDRVQVGSGLAMAFAVGQARFGPWTHVPLDEVLGVDSGVVVDLVVAEFDGDGAEEVVVLGERVASGLRLADVSIVRAEPGRVEGTAVAHFGGDLRRVLARDVDGDGRSDILLYGTTALAVNLAVLPGAAEGFAPALLQRVTLPPGEAGARLVGLYRIDEDDRLDLVMAGSMCVLVARGQGGGGFDRAVCWAPGLRTPTPWYSDALTIGDVDGDHRTDVLQIDQIDLLLHRGGRGLVASGGPVLLASGVERAALADLDGDGVQEIVAAKSGSLRIGRATGDGKFVFRAQEVSGGRGPNLQEVAARDWDGDERPDIAVVDAHGFTIVRQQP